MSDGLPLISEAFHTFLSEAPWLTDKTPPCPLSMEEMERRLTLMNADFDFICGNLRPNKICQSIRRSATACTGMDAKFADEMMVAHPRATRIDALTVEFRSDDFSQLPK